METFEEWICKLRDCNKLIIVEGKKDKESLARFGIANVITCASSSQLVIEKIREKEVIILTDLDKEGKKHYAILRSELQKRKIKIDNRFREFLFRKTDISHIEGIKYYEQETSLTR